MKSKKITGSIGRPKRTDKIRALNVKINEDVYDSLDSKSAESGMTKTAITEKALEEYLKKSKK